MLNLRGYTQLLPSMVLRLLHLLHSLLSLHFKAEGTNLPYNFLQAIGAVAMPALSLEGPPQYVPTVRAEVLHLQFRSQDLLRKPGLVQVQRAGRSRICCCHGNKKFRLYTQSLEIKIRSLFGYTWRTATPRYRGAPANRAARHGTKPARLSARSSARGTPRPGAPRRRQLRGTTRRRRPGPAARPLEGSGDLRGGWAGRGGGARSHGAERGRAGQSPPPTARSAPPEPRGPPRAPAAPPPPEGSPAAAPYSPAPPSAPRTGNARRPRPPDTWSAARPALRHRPATDPATAAPVATGGWRRGSAATPGTAAPRRSSRGDTLPHFPSFPPQVAPPRCPAACRPCSHLPPLPAVTQSRPHPHLHPTAQVLGTVPWARAAPCQDRAPWGQQRPAPPHSPYAAPRSLPAQPPSRAHPATPSPRLRTAQASPSSERSPTCTHSAMARGPAPTRRGGSRRPSGFPRPRRRRGNTSARRVAVRSRRGAFCRGTRRCRSSRSSRLRSAQPRGGAPPAPRGKPRPARRLGAGGAGAPLPRGAGRAPRLVLNPRGIRSGLGNPARPQPGGADRRCPSRALGTRVQLWCELGAAGRRGCCRGPQTSAGPQRERGGDPGTEASGATGAALQGRGPNSHVCPPAGHSVTRKP